MSIYMYIDPKQIRRLFKIGIGVLIKVSAVINAKPNGTKSEIDCFRSAFVFVSEV